jgi:hypothetical protein
MKRVNRSARICLQILAAKQEQAGFARRKRTVSSVNCSNRKISAGMESVISAFDAVFAKQKDFCEALPAKMKETVENE